MKCIEKLFGRGRKRKTRTMTDRLIQQKLKLHRQKSARTITFKFENDTYQRVNC